MINSFRGKYHFLSNFYPLIVELRGKTYSSVEHAFQSEKYRFTCMKRNERSSNCADARTIGSYKRLKKNWEEIKVNRMERILRSKFNIPKLRKLLKKTRKNKIVNTNCWHDVFWGVCTCSKHRGTGNCWDGY